MLQPILGICDRASHYASYMSDVKPQLLKWIYVFYVFTENLSI